MNLDLIRLQIEQAVKPQILERVLEPTAISDGIQQTLDYSKSKESIMVVPYLVAIGLIDKLIAPNSRNKVLELCSGPGNFTELLANVANFKNISGVDLSSRMINLAFERAVASRISNRVKFIQDDIISLKKIGDRTYDLVTFMNGAHHLPSIESLKSTLTRAAQVVKPEGIIFVMDPVRPKTIDVAERYIDLFGQDYIDKNLLHFHKDFYDSVMASFTPQEFVSAIPTTEDRTWIHILPFGYPAFQFVLGLPKSTTKIWQTKASSSALIRANLPQEYKLDYQLLKWTTLLGKKTKI